MYNSYQTEKSQTISEIFLQSGSLCRSRRFRHRTDSVQLHFQTLAIITGLLLKPELKGAGDKHCSHTHAHTGTLSTYRLIKKKTGKSHCTRLFTFFTAFHPVCMCFCACMQKSFETVVHLK